jgi:hypothetical protein
MLGKNIKKGKRKDEYLEEKEERKGKCKVRE